MKNKSVMILRDIFCHIFFTVFIGCLSTMAGKKPLQYEKPNIIIVCMDDMGYGDVGSYGGIEYNTPNINKLAAEGMRFTNFYSVQPVCSASRAALLTGCYSNRIGITGVLQPGSKIGLTSREESIAGMLKKVGYATGIIGKWHLGDAEKFLPLQNGFDYFFGLPYSNDMWPMDYNGIPVKPSDPLWKRKSTKPPLPLMEGNHPIKMINSMDDQNMLTTMYTEKAIDYIKSNKENPFFLYLAHSMVHVPLGVSEKFRGKSAQGLFGDVMMEIDWSLGQIVKTLNESELREKTLIIFTSDNGPWLEFGNQAGSTGGLREGKGTTWDGGNKEPAIMSWPGIIPEGTICNKLIANIDILPTLAKITGASLPSNQIDGVNCLSLLKNVIDADPRNHLLFYYRKNDLEAVRMGPWKLVLPHSYHSVLGEYPGMDGKWGKKHIVAVELELYDLRRDPGERYDVKGQHPEIIKEIMKIVEMARNDLGDDLTGNPGKNRRLP